MIHHHPDLHHLRSAAALVHAVEGVELELWTGSCEPVVVAHRGRPGVGLSACDLRRVVAMAARSRSERARDRCWVLGLEALSVTGSDVASAPGGVCRVGLGATVSWNWTTVLPVGSIPVVLADTAAELVADGVVEHRVVERCGAAVRVDADLGVSVVCIEEPATADPAMGDLAARLALRCRVEELLVDAERTIRNRSAGL